VETAVRLIESIDIPLPADMSHLHLAAVLRSGLALDLPDGSELTVGTLSPESPWVGKQIQSRPPSVVLEHTRIASVLRGTTVLLARPDTILQPGDRLLIVVQPEAIKDLGQYLGPPPPASISTKEAKADGG